MNAKVVHVISQRINIPVKPSNIFGSPNHIEVDVCTTCKAITFDPIAHYDWHQEQTK